MHGNLSKAQKAVGQTPKDLEVLIVFLVTHTTLFEPL